MADAGPLTPPVAGELPRSANEVGEPGRGASNEAPQEAENEKRQDRAAGPDVPIRVVVVDGPPAEGDQARKQPVDQADGQVPDWLVSPRSAVDQCTGARNGSWQALPALSTFSCRAMTLFTSPALAAASIACAAAA